MKTLQEVRQEIDMIEDKNLYYVYFLFKADGTPFYVGKGKKNRIFAHEYEARIFLEGKKWKGMNILKLNTIAKLWGYEEDVFYKIDSWYDNSELAGNREIFLVKEIGRKILGTGPLTNIRDGGDLMTEADRKLLSEKLKQFYVDHPEAREAISERLKQFYIDHPEMKDHLSEKLKDFCLEHPEFIESLQEAKDNWIDNHPEMYEAAEKKRLEVCSTKEHREKISGIMKTYFANNPDRLEKLKSQGAMYWVDNDEAIERVKYNNRVNSNHQSIINWYRDDSEEVINERLNKYKRHSEWLKEWHKTEEGKKKTKEASEKRNIRFRSDEHREHMSKKTKEFNRENKERFLATRAKVQEIFNKTRDIKEKCFRILESRLLKEGKIKRGLTKIDSDAIYRLRCRGLVPDDFPMYGGLEEWENFYIKISND